MTSDRRRLATIGTRLLLLVVAVGALWPLLAMPRFAAAANMWLYDGNEAPMNSFRYAPELETWLIEEHRVEPNLGDLRGHITAEEIERGLTIAPGHVNQIQVRFTHPDPVMAAWVTNTYSDVIKAFLPKSVNLRSEDAVPVLPGARPGDGALLLGSLGALLICSLGALGLGRQAPREAEVVAGAAALLGIAALAHHPVLGIIASAGVAAAGVWTCGWRWIVAAAVLVSALPEGVFAGLYGPRQLRLTFLALLAAAGIGLLWPWHRPVLPTRAGRVGMGALLAMGVWALATAPLSTLPRTSAAHAALALVFLGFFAAVWTQRWHTRRLVRQDLEALAIAGALGIVVPTLVMWTTPARWLLSPSSGRFQFLWSNPNAAGLIGAVLAVMCATFAWSAFATDEPGLRPHAIVWGLLVLITATATVLTGSRGALLGMAAGLGLLALGALRHRGFPYVLAGLAVAGVGGALAITKLGLFHRAGATSVDTGRIAMWQEGLHRFLAEPITGVGYRVGTLQGPSVTYHNLYVTILTELGAVGAVLAALAIAGLALAGLRARPRLAPAALTLAIAEFFDSSLVGFLGPAALLCWLLVIGSAALGRDRVDAASTVVDPAGTPA